jgi:hypothetical protein
MRIFWKTLSPVLLTSVQDERPQRVETPLSMSAIVRAHVFALWGKAKSDFRKLTLRAVFALTKTLFASAERLLRETSLCVSIESADNPAPASGH